MSNDFDLPPLPPPVPVALQPDAEFPESVTDEPERTCPNCGAPAHGPYCYACGQSEKGMIRHLSEVMSEFADIVFNVDSRIFRSLWDLYVRPGFLTTEYLGGRRARYVTPFRLFFFLSILAFFSMQMAVPDLKPGDLSAGVFDHISQATTPGEVKAAVDEEIEAAKKSSEESSDSSAAQEKFQQEEAEIRQRGVDRLQALKRDIDAAIAGTVVAEEDTPAARDKQPGIADKDSIGLDDASGNAETPDPRFVLHDLETGKQSIKISLFDPKWIAQHPVNVDWLSDGINARLTRTLVHMAEKAENVTEDPASLLPGFFSVLPQTLFVVMPLFAVLLKFFYIFKRRLYMEHLLVALHSHAFIFLSILVILGLRLLGDVAGSRVWLTEPLGWLSALAWIWLFVYLLLMQKRVYRQGWIMTILKFCIVGISYTFVLSIAFVFAVLASLALT